MATLYVIRDWPKHYENNRTRELKVLDWIRLPVKMDGDGYTELVDHPDGAAHFGAWIALLEVAARCETRGTLLRGDRNGVRRPHDAASLSRLTRLPAAVLEAAIARLLDIGWLDAQPFEINGLEAIPQESRTRPAPIPHDPAPVPQGSGGVPARARACDSRETREEKIRGEKRREETTLSAGSGRNGRKTSVGTTIEDPPGFAEFWGAYPRKEKRGDARKAWLQTGAIRPKLPEVLGAIERQRRSPQWVKEEGQFIPLPATWLRGECWANDAPPAAARPAPSPPSLARLHELACARVQDAGYARPEAVKLFDRIAELREPGEVRNFLRELHLPPISELGA